MSKIDPTAKGEPEVDTALGGPKVDPTATEGPGVGDTYAVESNRDGITCVKKVVKGGRKSSKSKKGSKKTRKNKKSNKKGKKSQKGGSSLAHSDFNASQSIATSVDNKLSLAGSIESGLFPGVQKITGGMSMGGMNIGAKNATTPKSMMGGMNMGEMKKTMGGGSGCSAKMLGGKKKKTSKK